MSSPRSPCNAQRQRDLTTVVYVVLGDVPDDVAALSPRAFALGVGPRTLKARRQVGFRPPGQARMHVGPGFLERGADRRRVRPAQVGVVIHPDQAAEVIVAFAHPSVEPPRSGRDDVAGQHADRPQAFRRRPHQLLHLEWGDRLDEQRVVLLPPGVEVENSSRHQLLRRRWYQRPGKRSGCSPPHARTMSHDLPKSCSSSSCASLAFTKKLGLA